MKILGKELREPAVLSLYLPRGDDDIIEIKAQAVLNYDEFHKLLPIPVVPDKIVKGGGKQPDFNNPSYLVQLKEYGEKKTQWLMLTSLKATPGLEWELIDMADPNTWGKFEEELTMSGFSDVERQRMLTLVMEANCLNETKLQEARERFLSENRQQTDLNGSISPNTVQASTSSGVPAKG